MARTAISLVCLSSALALAGCAHDATPGLRMLETRADYQAGEPEAQTLALASGPDGTGSLPIRLPPKVVNIWMNPHETSEHEYFWGAWLSVVVAGEEWGTQYQAPPASNVKPKVATAVKQSKKTKK